MTADAYRSEAAALDRELLACIERYAVDDFDDLALRIFAHQVKYNHPYAQYCASLGVTPDRLPANLEEIPPVPSAAFKEAALCTFDPSLAELVFETSGTTQGVGGKHYMETAALYDAALLAGFRRGMLIDANAPLRYLLLVPNPAQRPQSSLGYMMRSVAQRLGDGEHEWFLDGDVLRTEAFERAVQRAREDRVPVCIAGTAFAFVQLLDDLQAGDAQNLRLPEGSRIMETGGFKGRTRVVERAELYASLSATFALAQRHIIAEYGMTELTSQYYDKDESRVKVAPPWLRARVVGADGKTLPPGVVGALVHVDLANRSSCLAVQTEDLGIETGGGVVLIGREHGAELRGCSLDAEQLRALQHA